MGCYAYLKPKVTSLPPARERGGDSTFEQKKRRPKRLFPLLCLAIGLVLLGNVLLPLFWWQFSFALGDLGEEEIISPVVEFGSPPVGQPLLPRASSGFGALLLFSGNNTEDLTSFPLPPPGFNKRSYISSFTLSIPKLKIFDAEVEVDATNFDQHLALYPGSALPGDEGNAFISGHSALVQFFNPKDYKKIFSILPRMEIGDEVLINLAGVEYRFLVDSKEVVEPSDVSVISPSQGGRYITLMTCVPPGTSLKRLVVICKLATEGKG